MNRKIFTYAISVLIAVSSALLVKSISTNRSDLFDSNVEALANGEGGTVAIPCIQSISICFFLMKDANGNYYFASTTGFRNV